MSSFKIKLFIFPFTKCNDILSYMSRMRKTGRRKELTKKTTWKTFKSYCSKSKVHNTEPESKKKL